MTCPICDKIMRLVSRVFLGKGKARESWLCKCGIKIQKVEPVEE